MHQHPVDAGVAGVAANAVPPKQDFIGSSQIERLMNALKGHRCVQCGLDFYWGFMNLQLKEAKDEEVQ